MNGMTENKFDYLVALTLDGELHQFKIDSNDETDTETILKSAGLDVEFCEFMWISEPIKEIHNHEYISNTK